MFIFGVHNNLKLLNDFLKYGCKRIINKEVIQEIILWGQCVALKYATKTWKMQIFNKMLRQSHTLNCSSFLNTILGYLPVFITVEHLQVEKFRVNRFIMAQVLFCQLYFDSVFHSFLSAFVSLQFSHFRASKNLVMQLIRRRWKSARKMGARIF